MPLNDFEAVFFDAGGTLLYPHPSVGEIYEKVARTYGSAACAPELEKAFKSVWIERDGITSLESHSDEEKERRWWYETVQEVFSRCGGITRFDDFFHELYNLFAGPDVWRLYPETLEVLQELRRRKPCVAIISNWDSRLFRLCDEFGLTAHFDFILASAVFGAAKPSVRIFEEALKRSGMAPHKAVHIGDSLADDIGGAQRAGIYSVLLDRGGHYVKSEQTRHEPDLVIRDLRELL